MISPDPPGFSSPRSGLPAPGVDPGWCSPSAETPPATWSRSAATGVGCAAGIKGDLDHYTAANFLAGLLTILRDSGFAGLLLVPLDRILQLH